MSKKGYTFKPDLRKYRKERLETGLRYSINHKRILSIIDMTQESTVKCQTCGTDVPEENCFISEGRTLCEDCYIEVGQRIRVCDPWGERSKRIFRESHGLTGTEGLTDLQKRIYEFIKTRGKVTREDLAKEFALKSGELENEFAILRHCQLLKGKKEDDKIYLVLW